MANQRKVLPGPRHYGALGEFLKGLRLKANLTQRDVSIALGYSSAQFISNFECGRATPPLSKLKKMHELYGGSAQRLVEKIIEAEGLYLRDALQDNPKRKPRSPEATLN